MSGLASEGNRRSIVCLNSDQLSLHPTALAMIINVCVIPLVAFLFWAALWTVRALYTRKDDPRRYLAKRCLLSLMALWYITFVPVLRVALSFGLCVDVHDGLDIDAEDEIGTYWAVDTSIQCYQGDHARLFSFLILLFVCPVYGGLLILFIISLKICVQNLMNVNGWAYETMGFLYRSYRPGRLRYWELATILRKGVIAFLVFCAHLFDSVIPITGVAHFITIAIVGQILANPYRESFKNLNKFEVASLFVSLITTLIAIMLKEDDFPENYTRGLVTLVCFVMNLVTLFVFVYCVLKFWLVYFKLRGNAKKDHIFAEVRS